MVEARSYQMWIKRGKIGVQIGLALCIYIVFNNIAFIFIHCTLLHFKFCVEWKRLYSTDWAVFQCKWRTHLLIKKKLKPARLDSKNRAKAKPYVRTPDRTRLGSKFSSWRKFGSSQAGLGSIGALGRTTWMYAVSRNKLILICSREVRLYSNIWKYDGRYASRFYGNFCLPSFLKFSLRLREYLYLPVERRGYYVEKARSRDLFQNYGWWMVNEVTYGSAVLIAWSYRQKVMPVEPVGIFSCRW
jgi:hypothetical protein